MTAITRRGPLAAVGRALGLWSDPIRVRRNAPAGAVAQKCDHPDHTDALYTAVACPGCQVDSGSTSEVDR